MRRKVLSLLLAVCMVMSMMGTIAMAASSRFVDIAGHWAEESINEWADAGIIDGVGDGKYDPEGFVTRGQAAAVFARMLRLTDMGDLSAFTDVDHWSAEYLAKCYAAGVMTGDTATTMGPDKLMTREQFFTMFCRATGIEGQVSCVKYFTDAGEIAPYAAPSLYALVNLGYLQGRTATTLAPKATMKRCELLAFIDKSVAAYVTEGGVVSVQEPGVVLVVTDQPVQLTGTVNGAATIATTQSNASITTNNLVVNGSLDVISGGVNSNISLGGTTVSGNLNVTTNGANTNVNLSGVSAPTGAINVTANADNTNVSSAPAGTSVSSGNGSQNVTVNGGAVDTNDTEVVPVTPTTPVVPAPVVPVVCAHGSAYVVAGTPATHDTPGLTDGTYCPACGSWLIPQTVIPAEGHTYDSEWSKDETNHWHECSCGAKADVAAHTPGPAATETTAQTCTVCGYVIAPELGHVHASHLTKTEAKDATCTEAGNSAYWTCSCGKYFADAAAENEIEADSWVIPATGVHEYTYTNNGDDHTKTCTVGQESVNEAHTYDQEDGTKCVCGAVKPADPEPEKAIKFQLAVSSKNSDESVTKVEATVYDDYVAKLVVPGTPVSASNITLYAMMQNVSSLGVSDKREHTLPINTGIGGEGYDLETYLKNAVEFQSGTVNVSIQGADTFQYVLKGAPVPAETDSDYASNVITATPSSTAAARAAWQALTSHVETKPSTDSKVTIANGSYMIVGSEKLCFEGNDDLVLDNFNSLDELKQNIKDSVKIDSVDASSNVVIYLAAGTELAVDTSAAALRDNATITISGVTMTDGILSQIRTAANGETKLLVKELIDLVNEMVGAFDGQTVAVTVSFSDPVDPEPTPDPIEKEYAKFQLAVSSNYDAATYGGTGTTTVAAKVYNDYSIEIDLPGTHVNSDDVTIFAEMNNVGGLGVEGVRNHSINVNTGLNKTVALADWMPLVLDFASATVNVDVEGNQFVYNFVGAPLNYDDDSDQYDSNKITATANDPYAARAAWQALTAEGNIASDTCENNSKITIANGSWLVVDSEKLAFETERDLVLDNLNDLSALENMIRNNVALSTVTDEDKVVVFLKTGTELVVGSSYAKLLKDVTITITGINVSAASQASKANTATPLAAIRDAATTEVMVKNLVYLFDSIVGGMSGKTVNVAVYFADDNT